MLERDFIQEQFNALAPYVRERYAERDTLVVSGKREVNDVLTDVDLEVQRRIVHAIQERWPDDMIVAEESGFDTIADTAPARCWFIDPIDGTQNFVRGLFPIFGISIGFAKDGVPTAGGVDFPIMHDTFLAARGEGATLNGKPIRVSKNATLAEARVDADIGLVLHRPAILKHIDTILSDAGQIRSYGAAVAGLCAIASGHTDAYIPAHLNSWDMAAGILLVDEAGGRVTRFDGAPIDLFAPFHSFAATNGPLHDELLAHLNGTPPS